MEPSSRPLSTDSSSWRGWYESTENPLGEDDASSLGLTVASTVKAYVVDVYGTYLLRSHVYSAHRHDKNRSTH